jgi:hypothetical protein
MSRIEIRKTLRKGRVWIRKKDSRQYRVVCLARGENPGTRLWTEWQVVHEPVDGNYGAYVMPLETFLDQFRD